MTDWTYSYHRFGNKAAYTRAISTLGWGDTVPDNVVLDVLGTMYDVAEDGTQTILPGYHVNIALRSMALPDELLTSKIQPRSPSRVFAGI